MNGQNDTFEKVATIISQMCDIERSEITPESHTIDDLGIDSLDFLDVQFEIDKTFGIKLPVEEWIEDVNEGRAKSEDFFVLSNLCARVDELAGKQS